MTTDAYVGALLVLVPLAFGCLAAAALVVALLWRRLSALAAVVEAARQSAQSITPLVEATNKLEPAILKFEGRLAYLEKRFAGVPEGM